MAVSGIVLGLDIGGRSARIVGQSDGVIRLDADLGATAGAVPGTLWLSDGPVTARIEIGVDGAGPLPGDPATTGYRIVSPPNALATIARIGRDAGKARFGHALALPPPPRRSSEAPRTTDRRRVAGLVALTAVMAVVVVNRLDERFFRFEADVARVAMPGAVVQAEKAGRVVFVAGGAEVRAGEPVAGVRTASGYEQASVSTVDGRVVEVLVRSGDNVRPGDPLVVVSPAAARPYALARVRTADAVRLARGFDAVVTFADGSTVRSRVGGDDVSPLRTTGATAHVDVRVPLPDRARNRTGEPVDVRFVSTDRAAAVTRLAWLPTPGVISP